MVISLKNRFVKVTSNDGQIMTLPDTAPESFTTLPRWVSRVFDGY